MPSPVNLSDEAFDQAIADLIDEASGGRRTDDVDDTDGSGEDSPES